MSPSREEFAAFADGDLDGSRRAAVAAAIAADPELEAQVSAHRALRDQLSSHFAPIMAALLPEQLVRLLERGDLVVNLADARAKLDSNGSRSIPRWGWVAGPALAASLALAFFMPRQGQEELVQGELALALDQQLVATQAPDAPQRILLSFRNFAGEYCRAFTSQDDGGIACREVGGWRLEQAGAGVDVAKREYRMVGNSSADLLEQAQAMAAGPALDAAEESNARESGWR